MLYHAFISLELHHSLNKMIVRVKIFFPGAKTTCPRSCQNSAAHSRQANTINKINNIRVNIGCEIEVRVQYSVKGKYCASLHIIFYSNHPCAVPE